MARSPLRRRLRAHAAAAASQYRQHSVLRIYRVSENGLSKSKFFCVKKDLECTECKAIFKNFFFHFWVSFNAFLFQTLIKGKYLFICWFVTCKWPPNLQQFKKGTRYVLQISQQMACNINSIKTDCNVKNVHISQFQNALQTKFNLHISLCQSQKKHFALGQCVRVTVFQYIEYEYQSILHSGTILAF